MLSCDFYHKLKKLNSRLWIDENNVQNVYHADFKTAGLYIDDGKFVVAIAQNYVPEYTIEEINSQRILAPGWKNVVQHLINENLVSKEKAEKEFRTPFFHKRPLLSIPRRKIDLGFEEG